MEALSAEALTGHAQQDRVPSADALNALSRAQSAFAGASPELIGRQDLTSSAPAFITAPAFVGGQATTATEVAHAVSGLSKSVASDQ